MLTTKEIVAGMKFDEALREKRTPVVTWSVTVTATVGDRPEHFNLAFAAGAGIVDAIEGAERELAARGADLDSLRHWNLRTTYAHDGKHIEMDVRIVRVSRPSP